MGLGTTCAHPMPGKLDRPRHRVYRATRVQPGLGGYATTDVGKLPAILAAGEAAAERALPAIRAALRSGPAPA